MVGETNTAGVAGLGEEVFRTIPEAAEFVAKLLWKASENGFSPDDLHAIRLALEEAFRNAFSHGNANDPGKCVRVSWAVGKAEFNISIRDEGSGFDPKSVPDPTSPERLSEPSGRGLYLMRSYMEVVKHEDCGRVVRMLYRRRGWRRE